MDKNLNSDEQNDRSKSNRPMDHYGKLDWFKDSVYFKIVKFFLSFV